MTCGIYKIRNKINDKFYIGSSINIEKRWNVHRTLKGNSKVLTAAFKKYGFDNFEFTIVEVIKDRDTLIQREQYYLDLFKPFAVDNNGYNVRKVANSNIGLVHSDETRLKMSVSRKGSKRSEETKLKLSLLQKERGGYGPKTFSEDHRYKISVGNKGKHAGPKSEEHKRKLSESHKGKPGIPGFLGKNHSEESKKKISLSSLSKNLQPWETSSVLRKQECVDLWRKLDIIYDAWVMTGYRGHRRVCNHLVIALSPSVENMIKWFRKNGNPRNSVSWLKFNKET